jgi:hypothetical protein
MKKCRERSRVRNHSLRPSRNSQSRESRNTNLIKWDTYLDDHMDPYPDKGGCYRRKEESHFSQMAIQGNLKEGGDAKNVNIK